MHVGSVSPPGAEPVTPAVEAESQPLNHQGSLVLPEFYVNSKLKKKGGGRGERERPRKKQGGVEGGGLSPLAVKNPPANVGDISDAGSIPGLGRSPGEGNGNPLQYSCLENPMDRGAWQQSQTGLRD